jgi:hypothetical protein
MAFSLRVVGSPPSQESLSRAFCGALSPQRARPGCFPPVSRERAERLAEYTKAIAMGSTIASGKQ